MTQNSWGDIFQLPLGLFKLELQWRNLNLLMDRMDDMDAMDKTRSKQAGIFPLDFVF